MATQPATKTFIERAVFIEWAAMSAGDDGEWVEVYDYESITVQPTSAAVSWQGSNDLTTVTTIVTSTNPYASVIVPRFRYVRPLASNSVTPNLFASQQG